jgi:HK97 family phage prohead protease
MVTREYRFLQNSELRAAENLRISGYAAVFGEKSLPLNENRHTFVESVRRGAFSRSVTEGDVRALYNHDPAAILGRCIRGTGTMTLSEDQVGLRAAINLPNTQLGRDVHENVRLGNLSGMSFAFKARSDRWSAGGDQRELLDVELLDVSVVAWPAYPSTSVQARSIGLPVDAEILTYAGIAPTPVSGEEKMRLQLRLELLRRL